MKTQRARVIAILFIFSIIFICASYAFELPKWFPFNKENALREWQEKIFKGKVFYSVNPDVDGGYLSAQSNKACSGIFYRIKFDPKKFPMISWKWKVLKFPAKTTTANKQASWIEKDDYAARVYVIFPSWYFMNIKCIEYVWDEKISEDSVITSPYWHNIKLVVAQSGNKLNEWVIEERNIYEDYKRAFGVYPSDCVGAIALMTDSDNTSSSAEAFYDEIKAGYKK